jgi:hypothetical protein
MQGETAGRRFPENHTGSLLSPHIKGVKNSNRSFISLSLPFLEGVYKIMSSVVNKKTPCLHRLGPFPERLWSWAFHSLPKVMGILVMKGIT